MEQFPKYEYGSRTEDTEENKQDLIDLGQEVIYKFGRIGFEFGALKQVALMIAAAIGLYTQAGHDVVYDNECGSNEPGGRCQVSDMLTADLSFHLLSGLQHMQYGPGELMSVARAILITLAVASDSVLGGPKLHPNDVLDQLRDSYKQDPEVFERIRETLLKVSDTFNGLLPPEMQARLGGVQAIEIPQDATPDEIKDLIQSSIMAAMRQAGVLPPEDTISDADAAELQAMFEVPFPTDEDVQA